MSILLQHMLMSTPNPFVAAALNNGATFAPSTRHKLGSCLSAPIFLYTLPKLLWYRIRIQDADRDMPVGLTYRTKPNLSTCRSRFSGFKHGL